MSEPVKAPEFSYALAEHVKISEADEVIEVVSPFYRVTLRHLPAGTRQTMLKLACGPTLSCQIEREILDVDGTDALATFYSYVPYLAQHQMLYFQADGETGESPFATLIPISPSFQYRWLSLSPHRQYRLSRFAFLRRAEDGHFYLESPLSHAKIRLGQPVASVLIHRLGTAITLSELAEVAPDVNESAINSLLGLLVAGDFVISAPPHARFSEDDDQTLMQWEFHDLLFHSRSRLGRHSNPMGGSFRYLHQIPPQPAVKQLQSPYTLLLPQPDMDRVRVTDASLTAIMDARASVRTYGPVPITLDQLSEFLYRVARVKELFSVDDKGDFTKRPYPSGGASYEMEFYLTIDVCAGLERGFYWYDPLNHALSLISPPGPDTEGLLYDAHRSTGWMCRPQVLITLAARFQRVSWKYEGMAYSTILKNVGVLYSTMYLVATAMGLGPCGLGLGDSERFTRLAHTDYLVESSVGEFALGSGPARPA